MWPLDLRKTCDLLKGVCLGSALFKDGKRVISAVLRCYDSNGDAAPYETEAPGLDVIEYSIPFSQTMNTGKKIVGLEVLGIIIDFNYNGIADAVFIRDLNKSVGRNYKIVDIRWLNKKMKAFKLTTFDTSEYCTYPICKSRSGGTRPIKN